MILRDKVYCEEVAECPAVDDLAIYQVGCTDNGHGVFLACPREADLYALFGWLSDMICDDCSAKCSFCEWYV